ncbi:hypothetical protein K8I31_14050, partial [bacterium]|nr:hypothetical protein [bacterium]
ILIIAFFWLYSAQSYADLPPANPMQSAQQAQEIMRKVIETNQCWLDPQPIHASYVIYATSYTFQENLIDKYTQNTYTHNVNESGSARDRVGLELTTPLHQIYQNFDHYGFEIYGATTIDGIQTQIIIAHTSDDPVLITNTDVLGLTIHASFLAYYIDTERNVVLQIRPYSSGSIKDENVDAIKFSSDYYKLPDGYAPKSIRCERMFIPGFEPGFSDGIALKILFQYGQGVWILDEYEFIHEDIIDRGNLNEDYYSVGWMKVHSLVVYSGANATPTPTPFQVPTPTPINNDLPLIERVLLRNQPWLDPSAVEANYRMTSHRDGEDTALGPYEFNEGGNTALRAGCLLSTPLHVLYEYYANDALNTAVAISERGNSTINGRDVLILEVVPKNDDHEYVGFGGQVNKYARWGYDSIAYDSFKIYIDVVREVPLKNRNLCVESRRRN